MLHHVNACQNSNEGSGACSFPKDILRRGRKLHGVCLGVSTQLASDETVECLHEKFMWGDKPDVKDRNKLHCFSQMEHALPEVQNV